MPELLWLVADVPAILLCLVGLVLAQSKLLPRGGASVLATIGFALLLIDAVAQIGLQIYLARRPASDAIGTIVLWTMAQRVLFLGAMIFLTCANFAGRPRSAS
jgi:hypothetical protein